MSYDNEKKFLTEDNLSFQNLHEEFDKFWPEHSEVSKICNLIGSFWPKYLIFELKRSGAVITLETE